MHCLGYLIVEANDEGDALATVEDVLSTVWIGKYCDYYSLCNDESFEERWGDEKVLPLTSEEGKNKLEEIIKYNVGEVLSQYEQAKQHIEKGDIENALYHLRMAGGSPYVMLGFVRDNEALVSEKQLRAYKPEKTWIVPFDFHF